jgi:hypothetical protein
VAPRAPAAPAVSAPEPAPTLKYVEAPAVNSTDPLPDLAVNNPRVRSASYRRGVLSVVVSGVPDFGRALFTVDGRRYVRQTGNLRLKLKRAPNRVSVFTVVPGIGRTSGVRVKVKAATKRTQR